jgi:hypothetical protein
MSSEPLCWFGIADCSWDEEFDGKIAPMRNRWFGVAVSRELTAVLWGLRHRGESVVDI